ncbi:MAG: penicillin-binding protein 2 [Clostridiales bacterium]|nr:penicillin-binding protein 2 [Candidatus Equinaster intestinalis]
MKKVFIGKRIVLVYVMTVIIAFGAVLRIMVLNTDEKVKASAGENRYRIKLSDMRITVFDCNMNPITNSEDKIMAVVYPTPRAITAVSTFLSDTELTDLKKRLSSGMPAAVELPKEIECDGVYCFTLKCNKASVNVCPQLIGYTDSQGVGVMGIQKAYQNELYHEDISALVSTDGLGGLLLGGEAELSVDLRDYNSGIMLTIDSSLQTVLQNSMKSVKSGAAVLIEASSGKIRAMVSLPDFDTSNVAAYLGSEDSPFVNRALSAYNVGSVFKPVVAAAILESGIYSDYTVYCSGSAKIDDHIFGCHKSEGHGLVNLENAITQSCNVFFYNIAEKIGADKILETASLFRFGKTVDIGGIYTDAGSFPKNGSEQSPTDIANLSIGQGSVLLSPISLAMVYEAIANGGIYNTPTVFEGRVEKGALIPAKASSPTRAFTEKTADTLKNYLKNVVSSGTGNAAKPEYTTAAGKTATAQTGWQKNGRIIQNSWFCGFFPDDKPKYVAVVMIDDTDKNGTYAAPIFKNIADGVSLLEKSRNSTLN